MDISTLVTPANLGIGSAVAGFIGIILWFLKYNSPEQRRPRIRIERAKLQDRKKEIESSQPTPETSAELVRIEKRIKQIDTELGS